MSLHYVKWRTLVVWHVRRKDEFTVCGLRLTGDVLFAGDGFINAEVRGKKPRVCKLCDRMKSADTMRGSLMGQP